MHQVGLAHAHAAVEEEWVIGLRRALCDGLRRSGGKLVAAAYDERVKLVARVELRGGVPVKARLLRLRSCRSTLCQRSRAARLLRNVLRMRRLRSEATVFARRLSPFAGAGA